MAEKPHYISNEKLGVSSLMLEYIQQYTAWTFSCVTCTCKNTLVSRTIKDAML